MSEKLMFIFLLVSLYHYDISAGLSEDMLYFLSTITPLIRKSVTIGYRFQFGYLTPTWKIKNTSLPQITAPPLIA